MNLTSIGATSRSENVFSLSFFVPVRAVNLWDESRYDTQEECYSNVDQNFEKRYYKID